MYLVPDQPSYLVCFDDFALNSLVFNKLQAATNCNCLIQLGLAQKTPRGGGGHGRTTNRSGGSLVPLHERWRLDPEVAKRSNQLTMSRGSGPQQQRSPRRIGFIEYMVAVVEVVELLG